MARSKATMKRTQIYFPNQMHSRLKKEAKDKGVAMAEIVRRIVDKHYEKKLH